MVRELFLSMGYVDASRPVAEKVLKSGRSLFVCTGGEEESMRFKMMIYISIFISCISGVKLVSV